MEAWKQRRLEDRRHTASNSDTPNCSPSRCYCGHHHKGIAWHFYPQYVTGLQSKNSPLSFGLISMKCYSVMRREPGVNKALFNLLDFIFNLSSLRQNQSINMILIITDSDSFRDHSGASGLIQTSCFLSSEKPEDH